MARREIGEEDRVRMGEVARAHADYVQSGRHPFLWSLQTPETQQSILSALSAEFIGVRVALLQTVAAMALSDSRGNARL